MENLNTQQSNWPINEVKSNEESSPKRKRGGKLLGLSVLLVVLVGGWYVFSGSNNWRAVFLSNNQVYFGHFRWLPLTSTITLSDIHYLQAAQPLQQGKTDVREVRVIKLGDEIHGPEDKMVILKDNILFWEDLKEESVIVRRIKELQNQ